MLEIVAGSGSFLFHFLLDHLALALVPLLRRSSRKFTLNEFHWRNSVVSFAHAVVTSIWALVALYYCPHIPSDITYGKCPIAVPLLAYSAGYFVMDSVHMYSWAPSRSTFEYLGHHVIMITCFLSALISDKYIGFGVIALLVEVNSIFLHLRRMAKCLRIPITSACWNMVVYANVVTFIVFRFIILGWMIRWFVVNRQHASLGFYCLGAISVPGIMIMSIILFSRIIYTDFFSHRCAMKAVTLVSSSGEATASGENTVHTCMQ